MTQFDQSKSLQQLEGKDWGEPTFDSFLVGECHRLRRIPLCEFTVENLRIMIGQSIGLSYLVPMTLERLRHKPLAQGDYYPGDLLASVLRADAGFWAEHPELRHEARQIADDVLTRLRGLGRARQDRFRTTLDALSEAYDSFTRLETTRG